ncbi:MAG: DMT family transporter [Gammaproteobacteria bacterium]|nr:DMT family transporter [Gammaproteobacteria bacterium]
MTPAVRGLAWVILSGRVFILFPVMIRLAGSSLNPVQAAFLRYAISLLVLLPMAYRAGASVLRTRRPLLHAARGAVHGLGVLLFFYAVTSVPIAEVTALSYTSPIFVVIGAALFLGERVRPSTVIAVAAGFTGVLIILRPGFGDIGSGAIAILVSAPLFAASQLLAKTVVREDSSTTTVLYLSLFATATMLVPAMFVWETPSLRDLTLLAVAAVLATVSHLLLARGLKLVDVSLVQPAEFLRLVWSSILGFLLFDEVPGITLWVGSAVVIAGVWLAARRALGERAPARPHP